MKIVIIGGVAAGMSAAAKARREDKDATIIVYEKGHFVSYAACGLPYFAGDVVKSYQDLMIRTVEEFEQDGISVELGHEVTDIDVEKQRVTVYDSHHDRSFEDDYDRLIIATGASPVKPPIEGLDDVEFHTLGSMEDGIKMKTMLDNPEIEHITVIGAGYIGMEIIENALVYGKKVRLFEAESHILPSFDTTVTNIIHNAMVQKNVEIHTDETVTKMTVSPNGGYLLSTAKGDYATDGIILCVGIKPNTEFLKKTPIQCDEKGAVIVDRQMRTSAASVYAVGDCAQVYHALLKKNVYQPLATVANRCGRLVGVNVVGGHEEYPGVIGAAAVKILEYEVAKTGLDERQALEHGYKAKSVNIKTVNKPEYMGQDQIIIKLIFDEKTSEVLGIEAIGKKDVVHRVNAVGLAIHGHMTVRELALADLAYSPPFNNTWDAIQVAAKVAE